MAMPPKRPLISGEDPYKRNKPRDKRAEQDIADMKLEAESLYFFIRRSEQYGGPHPDFELAKQRLREAVALAAAGIEAMYDPRNVE